MEQIGILLLIVAFSAVRALVRRAKKDRKGEHARAPRPSTIARWLARVKDELEAATARSERGTTRPSAGLEDLWGLFGAGAAGSGLAPEAVPAPWEADDVVFREEEPPPAPSTRMREPEPPTPPPPASPRQLLEADALGSSRLRQAVVWSEILAPPVALRDSNPF